METKKKGIIIFMIFILVIGVLYVKSLPPSTDEIDGKYILYVNNEKFADCELKSGRITTSVFKGASTDGKFKILDNDVVEIQLSNKNDLLMNFQINRNDNHKIKSMTSDISFLERVNE